MRRLLRGEDGIQLIEYALVITFIALLLVAIVVEVGGGVRHIWESHAAHLTGTSDGAR